MRHSDVAVTYITALQEWRYDTIPHMLGTSEADLASMRYNRTDRPRDYRLKSPLWNPIGALINLKMFYSNMNLPFSKIYRGSMADIHGIQIETCFVMLVKKK